MLPITGVRINELHDQAIALWGGMAGIRDNECVERCLGAARMAEYYAGSGDGPVGLCFIGALLFYLCKNSCFVDGNKRTALLAAFDVLLSYGLTLNATNDEVRDYCLSIADGTVIGFEDVVRWLSRKLTTATDDESVVTVQS